MLQCGAACVCTDYQSLMSRSIFSFCSFFCCRVGGQGGVRYSRHAAYETCCCKAQKQCLFVLPSSFISQDKYKTLQHWSAPRSDYNPLPALANWELFPRHDASRIKVETEAPEFAAETNYLLKVAGATSWSCVAAAGVGDECREEPSAWIPKQHHHPKHPERWCQQWCKQTGEWLQVFIAS